MDFGRKKNDTVHFSIMMHYDGKLMVGVNTRRYVEGKVAFFDWMDVDYMGMIELKDMVKELNLFGSMSYYYKHLSTVVVIEEEDGHGDRDVNQGDGDGDVNQGEGDGNEDYTHSGDDTIDLEDFVDNEADESEDDRLFDIHVDRNVERGGLFMGKGKELMSTQANDNEDSNVEGQSDELGSLYGSSDEEAIEEHDQFHPNTDMANLIKVQGWDDFFNKQVVQRCNYRACHKDCKTHNAC
ncbi:hypothetical protein RHMOL_Rhmol10G0136200 [Rhododendron molle]|uniref:Uncharacterized protein n=1 Tax=Rhododendron molle TaxID=49168 RepID=A0ACC0M270_RHOML|nr:hypothetical protein RHMOL_Rhmol10G0136200 [Rhododendron molle]